MSIFVSCFTSMILFVTSDIKYSQVRHLFHVYLKRAEFHYFAIVNK